MSQLIGVLYIRLKQRAKSCKNPQNSGLKSQLLNRVIFSTLTGCLDFTVGYALPHARILLQPPATAG